MAAVGRGSGGGSDSCIALQTPLATSELTGPMCKKIAQGLGKSHSRVLEGTNLTSRQIVLNAASQTGKVHTLWDSDLSVVAHECPQGLVPGPL